MATPLQGTCTGVLKWQLPRSHSYPTELANTYRKPFYEQLVTR